MVRAVCGDDGFVREAAPGCGRASKAVVGLAPGVGLVDGERALPRLEDAESASQRGALRLTTSAS